MRQSSASTSTTESECIAASTAVKEIVWICQFYCNINVTSICEKDVTFYIDY